MLTKRQKQVLNFVQDFSEKEGYSPSLEEITHHLGLSSVSTAHFHVSRLTELGHLSKEGNKPRSIDLSSSTQMIQIQILGLIAAGRPIEAIMDRQTIAIPGSKLPRQGELFALKVSGNSMVDENINDGDIVLVKQQNTAENGQKVVALIDNREATLKTFYKERGHIRLQPANKEFEPIILNEASQINIQGVVLDVIREGVTAVPRTSLNKKLAEIKKVPLNKVIHGDAIEAMMNLPEGSIDLTVTSPPYDELRSYNGYNFNFEGIAQNLFRVTKKGGVVVWVVGDKIKNGNRSLTSFKQALFFQKIGFNVHDAMIYRKKNTPFMRTNAYTNCFEFMFVFSKGSPKLFNPLKTKTVRQGYEMLPFNKQADGMNKKILAELKPEKTLTNIWDYAVGLHGSTSDKIAFQHPAVFPEKLAEDHILSWTKEGDVVFDPMCGSGTTCKMAAINNRYYIGCDISKEYVELTKERLELYKY